MNNFVFQNTAKVYFGKSHLSDLGIDDKNFAVMAKKACSFTGGKLDSFTVIQPNDVEAIYRMCL